jgi:hypothetical protein
MRTLFKLRFIAVISCTVLLSGCGMMSGGKKPPVVSSAQTTFPMPSPQAPDNDPLKKHLLARRQVDPSDFKKTALYTDKGPAEEEPSPRSVPEPVLTAEPQIVPPVAPLQPQNQAVQVAAGSVSVTGVRIGHHPGKTRLVLDLDAQDRFEYALENEKSVLLVTLHGTQWAAANREEFGNDPLIEGYEVRPVPDGTVLAVRLKAPARLVMAAAFQPAQGRGHRIVFDLTAS